MITRAARAYLAAGFLVGCVSVFAQSNAPVIVTQPQGRFLNLGLPVTFSVSASGLAPLSYQWQRNGTNLADGGNVSGSASTNLNLSTTGTNDGGGYTAIVANTYGSVTSAVAKLTLILPCQPNSPPQRPRYTALDMGMNGLAGWIVTGINNRGEVVGSAFTGGFAEQQAFLYSNGTMIDLGTLGGPNSIAFGVNGNGQVVGYSDTTNGEDHAFLYADGAMTDLGSFGGTYSEALGINDSGQAVGYAYLGNGNYLAFLYGGGAVTNLGTLPGGANGAAQAINDLGQAAGWAGASDGSGHACIFSNGMVLDLGTSTGSSSQATSINNCGQVVGDLDFTNGQYHAFLYSHGKMTDLGTLGGAYSDALGINNRGQVVGDTTGAVYWNAYVYSEGTMFNLNDLIGTSVIPVWQAWAINDSGQITANTGDSDGYLLTPVPPGYNAEFELASITNSDGHLYPSSSSVANPNGPWSYSWSSSLDSSQTLFSTNFDQSTNDLEWTDGWLRDPSNAVPFVAVNYFGFPLGIWPPNTLGFAPGTNGEFSHVIWTAPASGAYAVSNTFTMLDTGAVAVCIVQRPTNGSPVHLVSTNVSASSTNFTYTATLLFNAGDQLDFAVGGGTNTPLHNTTALSPSIAPLPSSSNLGFSLTNAQVVSGSFVFSWVPLNTIPPVNYQVQFSTNPVSGTWNNLGAPIPATGSLLTATNAIATDPQRFYRVLVSQ